MRNDEQQVEELQKRVGTLTCKPILCGKMSSIH